MTHQSSALVVGLDIAGLLKGLRLIGGARERNTPPTAVEQFFVRPMNVDLAA